MTESRGADLLVRAREIDTRVPGVAPRRALAVRDDRIVALSGDPAGLDGWITGDTRVVDAPDATVLPAFDDTHTHLVLAGNAVHDVRVRRARDLPELLGLLRDRADATPDGEWVRTAPDWQESNLAERRMPTVDELDAVTDRHPVLVRRGGHNAVLNSAALRLAGVDVSTPDPPGGVIERDDAGRPTGRLIGDAVFRANRVLPRPGRDERLSGLDIASRDYAAAGVGTARDCAVSLSDLDVMRRARDADRLHVRIRALIWVGGATAPDALEDTLDALEPWRRTGDPLLRVCGVKFLLDGGLESAATEEPYCCRDFHGLTLWEPDELTDAVERVVRRGWPVGTHALGDRAVRLLLDVYERVLERNPGLPPGTLVLEHGGLADAAQRARAVALGVPVTVQHPVLHDTAGASLVHWGPERVARTFPVREWIDAGALVTGGSDHPVGPYGAMPSVWGMVTRGTVAGVRGPEHAITRDEAVTLHTTAAARLLGEQSVRGTLVPGRLADLTVWPADVLRCPDDELRDLSPLLTVVGGRVEHDATG